MTLEQAEELETNRWMLVEDELPQDWSLSSQRRKNLVNAILAWGESLADLRSRQSVEERIAAASEAINRYITEKRN